MTLPVQWGLDWGLGSFSTDIHWKQSHQRPASLEERPSHTVQNQNQVMGLKRFFSSPTSQKSNKCTYNIEVKRYVRDKRPIPETTEVTDNKVIPISTNVSEGIKQILMKSYPWTKPPREPNRPPRPLPRSPLRNKTRN